MTVDYVYAYGFRIHKRVTNRRYRTAVKWFLRRHPECSGGTMHGYLHFDPRDQQQYFVVECATEVVTV